MSAPAATPTYLSVVVPVFNETGNIEEFLKRLLPILRRRSDHFEVIFAVDPSTDGTEELIGKLREQEPSIKMLRFSRRVGQPMATIAGLEHSTGEIVAVMDVDLQDPPELLEEMLDRLAEGYEVVYAQRRNRDGETRVKKLVAKWGYRIIARFGDVEIPTNTGDFRVMTRRVVDELGRFPEAHGFLRGLVALVGFKQTSVQFDRPARHAGKGNYNQFVGSLRIGFNGLIAFSSALLNLSTVLGLLAAAGAFVVAGGYVVLKLAGVDFPIGSTTIVASVLLIGGFQLICIGIIGQYVGRIYDEVKHRPRYIVEEAVGFAPAEVSTHS
jgi:dolichol-phosphate mannosyltransferase